jgi:hypothetical protein
MEVSKRAERMKRTNDQLLTDTTCLRNDPTGGKSAIMTALLVCLGSRASITMRAPTLKDLIRHHAT